MTRPVLAQPVFLFVLHDAYRRRVRLHAAREPVPLVRTVTGRDPRRPRRGLFSGLRARFLTAHLVLLGTADAVLALLRRRVVAVPRPLPHAATALGRAFAPRAPSAPAGFFDVGRRH